jgi:HEAT repeat protein
MYRGQDIGDRDQLIQTCLQIIEKGGEKELYGVLPHISVVRSPSFVEPLLQLLKSGDSSRKEFAAFALGSIGDPRSIESFYQAFIDSTHSREAGGQSLQRAIIAALGEMGDEQAVGPLLKIYSLSIPRDHVGLQRKRLVLSALGNLAQQGSAEAENELIRFMDHRLPLRRVQAATELTAAYWHRPDEVSQSILDKMISLAEEDLDEVRDTVRSLLSNLADLGCRGAEEFLKQTNPKKFRKSGTVTNFCP